MRWQVERLRDALEPHGVLARLILLAIGAGTATLLLQLRPGRPVLHWVATAALTATAMAAAALAFAGRDERERDSVVPPAWAVAAAAATFLYLGFGGLSAAFVVGFVLLFRHRRWIPIAVAVVALGGVALVASGWLAAIDGATAASASSWICALAIVGVAAAAFWVRPAEPPVVAADAEEITHTPHTGVHVDGYAVGRCLGSGGMGHVYRGIRLADGRGVAIKLMNQVADPGSVRARRFRREFEALAHLSSPNVVHVLDGGVTPSGYPYLVMELLEGEDLRHMIKARGALSLTETLNMVDEVARGLEAAHALGIIHRDIKPPNIFLAGERWKILDFGLSKSDGEHTSITKGSAVGTPGFMAPEQALAEAVDHRCDVFGLAAVAYAALTGRVPFSGTDSIEVMVNVVSRQPAAASTLAGVHPDVDLVLALGLAKHVAARPESALGFASLLRAAAVGALEEPTRRAAEELVALHPWDSSAGVEVGPRWSPSCQTAPDGPTERDEPTEKRKREPTAPTSTGPTSAAPTSAGPASAAPTSDHDAPTISLGGSGSLAVTARVIAGR